MTDLEQQLAWDENAEAWRKSIEDGYDPNHSEVITPTLHQLLGNVSKKRVLDLGCGEGSFARFLARHGAKVTGLDFSTKMIDIAKSIEPDIPVTYQVGSMTDLTDYFTPGHFDICVANMSLFCLSELSVVFDQAHKVLSENGRFVFCILHPCFDLRIYETAARTIETDDPFSDGTYWPKGSYFNSKQCYRRIRDYFPSETVIYVRSLGEYMSNLSAAGFLVSEIVEPRPPQTLLDNPKWLSRDKYGKFPFFLAFEAKKDAGIAPSHAHVKFEEFLKARDWEKFQSLKNVAISISLEAAELLEHFQWLAEHEEEEYARDNRDEIAQELSDVYLNVRLLEEKLGVSLESLATEKVRSLSERYSILDNKGRYVSPRRKEKSHPNLRKKIRK